MPNLLTNLKTWFSPIEQPIYPMPPMYAVELFLDGYVDNLQYDVFGTTIDIKLLTKSESHCQGEHTTGTAEFKIRDLTTGASRKVRNTWTSPVERRAARGGIMREIHDLVFGHLRDTDTSWA